MKFFVNRFPTYWCEEKRIRYWLSVFRGLTGNSDPCWVIHVKCMFALGGSQLNHIIRIIYIYQLMCKVIVNFVSMLWLSYIVQSLVPWDNELCYSCPKWAHTFCLYSKWLVVNVFFSICSLACEINSTSQICLLDRHLRHCLDIVVFYTELTGLSRSYFNVAEVLNLCVQCMLPKDLYRENILERLQFRSCLEVHLQDFIKFVVTMKITDVLCLALFADEKLCIKLCHRGIMRALVVN